MKRTLPPSRLGAVLHKPQQKSIIGAAIIHDWLYAVGGPDPAAAKEKADQIFLFELEAAGVNFVKRNLMYLAVSQFGGRNFGAQEEMRFRDPRTGNVYLQDKPDNAVIDTIAPGCGNFFDLYWNPDDAMGFLGYNLDPAFIQSWIDLP